VLPAVPDTSVLLTTSADDVSLFLSKVFSLLLHPLFLGLLLAVAGSILAYGWTRYGWVVVGLGILVVWIPAIPVVSTGLQWTLERQFPPRAVEDVPSADAIVPLGGAVGAPLPPRVYPDLNGASDRVWHAARLYHAGKAPRIIASGGTLPWKDQAYREASAMEVLLRSWDVPADSILTESTSANTYQNAVNTAEILRDRGYDRVLLVTSALHMRRALDTFRSAGVNAVPAATDHQVLDEPFTLFSFVPNAGALQGSTAVIHEYVGYAVYWWRGWITESPSRSEDVANKEDPVSVTRRSRPSLFSTVGLHR
jgi:uncharacterized SAM-binding protein YcdF (DUF218 family)